MCSTNEVAALIEELQFTLGEGSCMDAHLQHRPVIEPDLADPAVDRWALFSEPAVAAGARRVRVPRRRRADRYFAALNLITTLQDR